MNRPRAFWLGLVEFRGSVTTHFDGNDLLDWYERGREFAHVLTFRRYDN